VLQQRLINWGYAICDIAMRRWVEPQAPKPDDFPYPAAGLG
jgi:NTE family protein